MDPNEKVANDKVSRLENEIKVLKNEVQAVLLDLRESYLNMENPFHTASGPAAIQPIVIQERAPASEPRQGSPKDRSRMEESETESLAPEEKPDRGALEAGENSRSECISFMGPEAPVTPQEVKTTSGGHSGPIAQAAPPAPGMENNSKLDLATVAGLTAWVEDSCQKIGRERSEAILDISTAMGYLTEEIRPILVKLIALSPRFASETPVGTRGYLDSLMRLNGLLSKENRDESAFLLLSLLSGEARHG